jgi:crotonobetainyl-CoA:carnitine CoA-transferase CaiB-like acyl-CoA transferase
MTLAAAVCATLMSLGRTGAGQLVSTSLYRQGAYTVSFDLNTYLMSGQPIAIGQREKMFNPCMNNYATGDGRRFWIVGLEVDRHWPPLCRAVGRAEWLDDPRFADARSRAVNAVELIGELDQIFATKTLDEWAEIFAGEPDFFGHRSTPSKMSSPTSAHAAAAWSTPLGVPPRKARCRWSHTGDHARRLRACAPQLGQHIDGVLRAEARRQLIQSKTYRLR